MRRKTNTTQGEAPLKKYSVKLTQEERAGLQKLIGQGEAPARKLTHARILLKADSGEAGPGWSDQAISEALEVGTATVERVRERLVEERLGARLVLTTNTSGHMSEFYEVFRQTLLELQKPAYLERLRANEAHRGTNESLSIASASGELRMTVPMLYLEGEKPDGEPFLSPLLHGDKSKAQSLVNAQIALYRYQ